MKSTFIAAAAFSVLSTAALADPVDGLWKTEPGDEGNYLHVSIQPCGSAICGTIDSAFDASGNQSLNYENLGKQMIWDMQAQGDGAYSGGKIWAPDRDKTYGSKMQLESQNKLTVKGCAAGGLICRGQTWTRVQ
ncbi:MULTISPECIES: DUF2147 domain-containing protein [unclassified Ruegeria]|uniref:DUF2147 domain-containing protein n=1 Tax=unclassified Ruegeria TaxID=2625375 RepID=UPI001ADA5BD8|nr:MULTISPECIES: DUF2147 domain-containing protein [unclassified Ruegeria]MBO9411263.1 DUF2147 domain-containing protein [Ruegeria sp. R8_1]MBO9415464.1 DUF2147 domain-containing protein [Ruegeria sp. R8_2]